MRLSTKGRYATRLLLAIARASNGKPVSKQTLAKMESISVDYVAQILVLLRRAGLVESLRGKNGGFRLALEPAEIRVWGILNAADEALTLAPCLGEKEHCSRSDRCVCRALWEEALGQLERYFSGITLQDLLDRSGSEQDSEAENSPTDVRMEQSDYVRI